ncbi:MAG: hypothetical protein JWO35_861 [Candidatus Saccharibacteria bacterium]|nr:hypothetical protein [Candidatus Saccharibacteria bacterium]
MTNLGPETNRTVGNDRPRRTLTRPEPAQKTGLRRLLSAFSRPSGDPYIEGTRPRPADTGPVQTVIPAAHEPSLVISPQLRAVGEQIAANRAEAQRPQEGTLQALGELAVPKPPSRR